MMHVSHAPTTDPGASFYCPTCNRGFASHELRVIQAGAGVLRMCPGCGGAVRAEASRVVEPFAKTLAGAFVWPVRPGVVGWTLGFAVGCAILSIFPYGGALATCAELAFLFLVIRRTGQGSRYMETPDFEGDVFDWIRPLLRYVAALVTSFAPAVAIAIFGGRELLGLAGAALVFGALYLPAAIIVAAHSESASLNPLPGLALIRRIPGPYFLTVLFLVLALSTHVGISIFLGELRESVGHLTAALAGPVLGMYPSVVCARMLGLLIREHAEEL